MAPSNAQIAMCFMFPLYLPSTAHLYVINAARAFTSSTPTELLKRTPGKGERRNEESLPFYHKWHRGIIGEALILLKRQHLVTISDQQLFI